MHTLVRRFIGFSQIKASDTALLFHRIGGFEGSREEIRDLAGFMKPGHAVSGKAAGRLSLSRSRPGSSASGFSCPGAYPGCRTAPSSTAPDMLFRRRPDAGPSGLRYGRQTLIPAYRPSLLQKPACNGSSSFCFWRTLLFCAASSFGASWFTRSAMDLS